MQSIPPVHLSPFTEGRKGRGAPGAGGVAGQRDPADLQSRVRDPDADVTGPGGVFVGGVGRAHPTL